MTSQGMKKYVDRTQMLASNAVSVTKYLNTQIIWRNTWGNMKTPKQNLSAFSVAKPSTIVAVYTDIWGKHVIHVSNSVVKYILQYVLFWSDSIILELVSSNDYYQIIIQQCNNIRLRLRNILLYDCHNLHKMSYIVES